MLPPNLEQQINTSLALKLCFFTSLCNVSVPVILHRLNSATYNFWECIRWLPAPAAGSRGGGGASKMRPVGRIRAADGLNPAREMIM